MPQLTFPVHDIPGSKQLLVDVIVAAGAATLQGLRAAGRPIPPPVFVKGVVDTASTITAVTPKILQWVGAQPVQQSSTTTQGVGGQVAVQLHTANVVITDRRVPGSPWFVVGELVVMTWAGDPPNEVIIGMDVLLTCTMLLDGPAGSFTLTF
jgi:hypothetical protein